MGGSSASLSEYTDRESIENDLDRVVDAVMTDAAEVDTVDRADSGPDEGEMMCADKDRCRLVELIEPRPVVSAMHSRPVLS